MFVRTNAHRAARRKAWLVSALLCTAPLGACVSAVEDTTAFGFGAPTAPAAAMAAAAPTAASAEGGASLPADAAALAEVANGETGAEVAAAAEAAPAAAAAPPGSPFLANAASIAAYNGRTVSEGRAEPEAPAAGGGTRFASLFSNGESRTPLPNAERTRERRVVLQREGAPVDVGGDNLPGVDANSLFEIGQRASLDDEEYMEDTGAGDGSYEVASLSGLARLAPNGLMAQRPDVVTTCFEPKLVGMLRAIERRFGTKVVVTSGYRSPQHNRRVNGARHSQHMACKAADILVPGADRFAVAAFARTLPGRGGVGTYCHTAAVHVDVGRQRDWNWGCRRRG